MSSTTNHIPSMNTTKQSLFLLIVLLLHSCLCTPSTNTHGFGSGKPYSSFPPTYPGYSGNVLTIKIPTCGNPMYGETPSNDGKEFIPFIYFKVLFLFLNLGNFRWRWKYDHESWKS
jgi:hypothetical protein